MLPDLIEFHYEPNLSLTDLKALLEIKYVDQDVFSILSSSSFSIDTIVSLKTKSRKLFNKLSEDLHFPIDENELYIPHLLAQETVNIVDRYAEKCNQYQTPPLRLIMNALYGTLSHLDLSCYRLDETNLYFACEALQGPPPVRLAVLNLSKSIFTKDSCVALAAFVEGSELETLILSDCLIGSECAEVLAESIPDCNLIELNLHNCNLEDRGGVAIILAMSLNKTIKNLDLSKNKLYIETALELGKMLRVNNTIEVLNLCWNDLYSSAECKKLIQGLRSNKSIIELNFSWNGLCDMMVVRALAGFVRRNKILLRLYLEYNCFTEIQFMKIVEGVKKNNSLEEVYLGGNMWTLNSMKCFGSPPYSSKLKIMSFGEFCYLPGFIDDMCINAQETSENDLKIIYKGRILPNPPEEVDMALVILARCKFLAMKPKKKVLQRDMGQFMLDLMDNEKDSILRSDFLNLLNSFKAKLDPDLIEILTEHFTSKQKKGKKFVKVVDIKIMADMYLSKFPTERIPPPPPKPVKQKEKEKKKTK